MMALYADHDGDNVCWDELPGWEPWEGDEPEPDQHVGLCAYCDEADPAKIRENPEPWGGRACCEACFNLLIGGSEDDPPWRCGNAGSGG